MSLSIAEDSKRQKWFSLVCEAYSIIDDGISKAILREEAKGKRLACAKGCFNCCKTHKDIPLYPHEITGIYWYVLERLSPPLIEILKFQLLTYKKGTACPFLIDGLCSIHPMRPAACRLFNVFNRRCHEGEDPYYTRIEDVLSPPREYLQRAFLKVLPFYNIKGDIEKNLVEEFIRSQALILQAFEWKSLGIRIKCTG